MKKRHFKWRGEASNQKDKFEKSAEKGCSRGRFHDRGGFHDKGWAKGWLDGPFEKGHSLMSSKIIRIKFNVTIAKDLGI